MSSTLMLDGGIGSGSKAFVVRYSPQGEPEWAQQSSAAAAYSFVEGNSIGIDGAGNIYVTGSLDDSVTIGSVTVRLPRTNNTGFTGLTIGGYLARFSGSTGALQVLVPAYHYSTPINFLAYSHPKLAVAFNGDVFLLNHFSHSIVFADTTLTSRGQSDIVAAKYGAQGDFQWAQQFGGAQADEVGEGVADESSNLYITGSFTGLAAFGNITMAGAGNSDGCLIKCSPQGTVQWVQSGAGPGSDGLHDISLDAAGNLCVVGHFSNTARFNSATLTSAGDTDILVASYNSLGQLHWLQQASGPAYNLGFNIGLDASGALYIMGSFTDTSVFGSITITSKAPYEAFIAKLAYVTLSTHTTSSTSVALYPNPASSAVHLSGIPTNSAVQLLDATGRVVRTTTITSGTTVSVQGLLPGLYVVRATDAQGRLYAGRLRVE
ncbi:SBBP repeat-containing protein [Hymenobacter sp. YC55]|uniref:SBBP repeat-containing protein n=1 Tax=Hymenobacter sp. YC55 TaxID=3034019 RepID=UPI0023F805E3|nr:SBBP repeat-containing protein [Hymenobacter sp. YC55]MDF7810955.1 SBBP repeat-containing protein [Hymenobacter sp. YC55]